MAWRDILVHLKHHKDWSPQIDVAIRLAAAHKARLTGLYTLRDVAMMKLIYGATSAAADEAASRAQSRVDAAERRFLDAAKAAAVASARIRRRRNAATAKPPKAKAAQIGTKKLYPIMAIIQRTRHSASAHGLASKYAAIAGAKR